MAVTVDNATLSPFHSAEGSHTFTHAAGTLTNGYVVVACRYQTLRSVTSVTFDGTEMVQIGSTVTGAAILLDVWGLKNPSNGGTKTIIVTFSGSASNYCAAITYNGVDQTTPVSGVIPAGPTTDQNATVSITSATGDLAYAIVALAAGKAVTSGSGQTTDWNFGNTESFFGDHKDGANPVTISWTWSSGAAEWVVEGFSLTAAGGSPVNINAATIAAIGAIPEPTIQSSVLLGGSELWIPSIVTLPPPTISMGTMAAITAVPIQCAVSLPVPSISWTGQPITLGGNSGIQAILHPGSGFHRTKKQSAVIKRYRRTA